MGSREAVLDPDGGWVARHVREYVDTDGRHGHIFHGMPTLLLTTRGRKSGELRRTALIYGRDEATIFSHYERYQAKTARDIPVVILEPSR